MSERSVSAPKLGALPKDAKTEEMCISFFDLSRITEWASSEEDEKTAAFFQDFYQLSHDTITPAGGRIVKFIGDAGLAVCPKEKAADFITALAELSLKVRERANAYGLDTYLNTNVHYGPVVVGSYGPKGHESFDVLGKAVNVAARLGRRGLTLSPQAFRCLGPEARKKFEKFTPPVTYRYRY